MKSTTRYLAYSRLISINSNVKGVDVLSAEQRWTSLGEVIGTLHGTRLIRRVRARARVCLRVCIIERLRVVKIDDSVAGNESSARIRTHGNRVAGRAIDKSRYHTVEMVTERNLLSTYGICMYVARDWRFHSWWQRPVPSHRESRSLALCHRF